MLFALFLLYHGHLPYHATLQVHFVHTLLTLWLPMSDLNWNGISSVVLHAAVGIIFWRLVRKTVTAPCSSDAVQLFAGILLVQHGNAKTANLNTPQGNLKSQLRLPLRLPLSSVVHTSALSRSPALAGHGDFMSPVCVRIRPPSPCRIQGTLGCQWDCRRGTYLGLYCLMFLT